MSSILLRSLSDREGIARIIRSTASFLHQVGISFVVPLIGMPRMLVPCLSGSSSIRQTGSYLWAGFFGSEAAFLISLSIMCAALPAPIIIVRCFWYFLPSTAMVRNAFRKMKRNSITPIVPIPKEIKIYCQRGFALNVLDKSVVSPEPMSIPKKQET